QRSVAVERRYAPELERRRWPTPGLGCKVDQQGRLQGSMYNQPRITFDIARIGQVVVDAVAVVGESRITEEKRRRRLDGFAPGSSRSRCYRALDRLVRCAALGGTINDILSLKNCDFAVTRDF